MTRLTGKDTPGSRGIIKGQVVERAASCRMEGMEFTLAVWIVVAGVAGAAAYVCWNKFGPRQSAEFEAGTVSQSWLTDHQSGKNGDRFS